MTNKLKKCKIYLIKKFYFKAFKLKHFHKVEVEKKRKRAKRAKINFSLNKFDYFIYSNFKLKYKKSLIIISSILFLFLSIDILIIPLAYFKNSLILLFNSSSVY